MTCIRKILRSFHLYLPALPLLLSACSPSSILDAATPKEGYRVERDLAYGALPRQTLDLYIPENGGREAPLIVFFYGGNWRMGEKETYRFVGQSLSALGYAVAVPDYRVYPEATYPVFLEDCARAVAWLRAHAGEYGVDGAHPILAGHSAGAYNAVMLALNRDYLAEAGGEAGSIRAVIGLAGPYDFLPMTHRKTIEVFNGVRDDPATQPITYVRTNAPPMLLLHGLDDDTVYPRNSRNLKAALERLGNRVTLKEYEDAGHVGIVLGLATGIRWNERVRDDVAAFLRTLH